MDVVTAIFLGIIQGFTEWLPISSSGHLVIAQTLLGVDVPAEFDIVIMAGTTAALLIYFREKIFFLVKGLLQGEQVAGKYVLLMVVAGIMTAAIGFAGKTFFKSLFNEPFVVSLFIIATGFFLLLASKSAARRQGLTPWAATAVGIAQGLAVAPGISRSGSTIGTAMLLGVKPQEAAEFSFLIGAPAMAVASLIEFAGTPAAGIELPVLAAGTLAAFIAGYVSIDFFMKLLGQNKLHLFAYYCILAGSTFAAVVLLAG